MNPTMVVTGASSGIGAAVARGAVARGWCVLGLARRAERLGELATELGEGFRPVVADVTDPAARTALSAALPAGPGKVRALVNCAGLSRGFGPFQDGRPDTWDLMVDTNVRGLLSVTHAVLPHMPPDAGAVIVNIGSIAGRYAYQGGNVYGATKAFVHLLSDNLRVDLEGTGIRVVCVAPGMTRTEFALTRYNGDAERADALYAGLEPLSAQDVADAVLFAVDLPARVTVNYLEMMPTGQRFGLALGPARRSS